MQKLTPRRPSSKYLILIPVLSAAVLLTYVLFFWRLGTLTPGYSPTEVLALQNSSSLQNILENPTYAPHKLLQLAAQNAGLGGQFWMRAVSVTFALLLLFFFYRILRLWFGRFIGTAGLILLAATPWVILLARSATPNILLLVPIALIWVYLWASPSNGRLILKWLAAGAVLGVSLFVPGAVWFILAAALIENQRLKSLLRCFKQPAFYIGLLFFLIIISPLVRAIIINPSVGREILLLPAAWPGLSSIFESLVWTLSSLAWRTQQHYDLLVGRLALLNLIQIAFLVFGAYAMWTRAKKQMLLLLAALAVGVFGAALNQDLIFITIGLPALLIIAIAGLRYLYMEWRNIFPLNPLPRALVLVMISAVIVLHTLIGIRYALAAWPQTMDTKNTYMLQ